MSIFSKLFRLFITVVLMPLIPMALLLAYYQNRQKTSALENHYNVAEIVSSELNQYVINLTDRLAFADVLPLQQSRPVLENKLQQALENDPSLTFLAVLSADGTEKGRAEQKVENQTDLAAVKVPASTENFSATHLQAWLSRPEEGSLSLEFVYPLEREHFLYGRQNVADVLDRLNQMRIGRTGQIYLVAADGAIYRTPYQLTPNISASKLAAKLNGKTQIINSLPSTEGTLVGAVSSEPRLGVYVVALQPKEEALRSLYLSNIVIFLFVISIAMLSYFGALAFSRSLGEPIARLMKGAQEVSRGNLDYQVEEETNWSEFQELIASFNKMIADLKDYQALQLKTQISEMKEQVFRAVAHDLRAPLIGLQGYIYLLSSGKVSAQEQEEYLQRMTEAAQNLSSLLEDVLAVSRVETGMALPQREWVEVAPLVQNVLHTQQPAADAKGLTVTADISAGLKAWADPKLLSRILTNLVSNAVKYTPKGFVQIKAWNTEAETLFSVTDSGIGLTPEQCERLFEKFHQVDGKKEGYGLGLFISRQLARAHGGDLSVVSVPKQGSTFTLRLPKEEK